MPEDDKKATGFSDAEKAAMREHAKELKPSKLSGEEMIQEKIAEMPEPDRATAERLHTIIKENAPMLTPKTWYGMPAYANAEGKVVCFFQPASKFGARYGTLGFNDPAKLDDGTFWPNAYALTELTPAVEAEIAELVKKAVR